MSTDDKTTQDAKPAKAAPLTPPALALAAGEVVAVPLAEIDLEDTTYMFRAALRIGPLADSITEQGIQVPVMLRKQDGADLYQIVSGFRRCSAAAKARLAEVPAIVRDLTDEAAFRVSVLENSSRKTYSDIDRANVIAQYEKRGHTAAEIEKVMGLNERQVRNLKALLKLPRGVQDAVDDPDQYVSTTHAITLKALQEKLDGVEYDEWIKRTNDEKLSVAQLKRAVRKEHATASTPGFTSLFQSKGTDVKAGTFRFSPVAVTVAELSPGEKAALMAELERVLKALG